MTHKAKLILIAALAATRLAATPAFGQSFSEGYGTGNRVPFNSDPVARKIAPHQKRVHAARYHNGFNSYAMELRPESDFNSDSPAATGGGSLGYNQNLYKY
jgi:hypothetical protein